MLSARAKDAWSAVLVGQALMEKKIDEALIKNGQVPLDVYDVLLQLEMSPNFMMKMSDLAGAILLSRSGLTRLVDRLEKQRFIERVGCNKDRRSIYAKLTAEGLDARKKAWPLFQDQIEKIFEAHLVDGDAEVLSRLFWGISKSLGFEGSCTGDLP